MPSVNVKEYESIDVSVRRFKRACEKDNILADIRRHEFYEKPKWKRKRRKMAAVKRHMKQLAREKMTLLGRTKSKKPAAPARGRRPAAQPTSS